MFDSISEGRFELKSFVMAEVVFGFDVYEELRLIVKWSSGRSLHSGGVVSVGGCFLDADHVVPEIGSGHLD